MQPAANNDEVRVTGRLAADAHLGYTTDTPPVAVLTFEVHPAKGLPYQVRQVLGADPNVHFVAGAKAGSLRRGTAVQVFAKGLRTQSDHGVALLHLLDVTNVFPLTAPADRTQATTTTEDA